jgi:hypothetical protein
MREEKTLIQDDKYDADFVRQHIKLPNNPEDTPNIIGWSGPSRSGTSALLFLLASHPQVDRAYFQPQKTLLRNGQPEVVLYAADKLVCMKETFFSWEIIDRYDPVDVLLRAGVPAGKITWFFLLRDPLQTFGSWRTMEPGIEPDPFVLSYWQEHTVNLWHKYKHSKINAVPLVYDLFHEQEERVVNRLLSISGMDPVSSSLEFDNTAISRKLVPGQAADERVFERFVKPTVSRGRFIYKANSNSIGTEVAEKVIELCRERYEAFLQQAKDEIGI